MNKILLIYLSLLIILFGVSCNKGPECELGFTGETCEDQITPSLIKIIPNTIHFIDFPSFNPSTDGTFDPYTTIDAHPDLYFELRYTRTDALLWGPSEVIENATMKPTDPFTHPEITINPIGDTYTLKFNLFDKELSNEEGTTDQAGGTLSFDLYI